MRVTKCDICKKEIKGDIVHADSGYRHSADLCMDCGSPIIKFLKKYKFIEE